MKCEKCGDAPRTFKATYGYIIDYFSLMFEVSNATIMARHEAGLLAGLIKDAEATGAWILPRKISDTLYRRKYNLSMDEIAEKLGVSVYYVGLWHYSGKLEGMLEGIK